MLVLSLLVAPIVMTNNLCARRRTLAQKGRVINALLMAYSVFFHLSPLPCIELPRVVMCLCFSGIAFIAQSHQKCVFIPDSESQCHHCIKLKVKCLFKLSSQGRRNDLITKTDANDPTWQPANANESVHYHHCNDDDSCHGCIDHVTVDDCGVSVERSLRPPSWVPSQGRCNDLIARTDANTHNNQL